MLTTLQLMPYRALRDSGALPQQVYVQTFRDGLRWTARLEVLRVVFGINDYPTLRAVADAGDDILLAPYRALRDAGHSPVAVGRALRADGYARFDAVRALWWLYDLSGPEAMRVLRQSGRAPH